LQQIPLQHHSRRNEGRHNPRRSLLCRQLRRRCAVRFTHSSPAHLTQSQLTHHNSVEAPAPNSPKLVASAPVAQTKELAGLNVVSQDENGITLTGANGDYFWLPLTAYAGLVAAAVGSTIGGLAWWAKSRDDIAVADYSAFLAATKELATRDIPATPEGSKALTVIGAQGDSVMLADESGEWFWLPMGVAALLAASVAGATAAGFATLPKNN